MAPGTPLADPNTRQFKVGQTTILAAGVAAVCLLQFVLAERRPPVGASLLLLGLMAVIVAVTARALFWRYADEVALEPAALTVRRGNARTTLPFDEIADIAAVPWNLRTAIAITPRRAVAPFGERILFLPVGWKSQDARQLAHFAALLRERVAGAAPGSR